MTYSLDTNVVSEVSKRRWSPPLLAWFSSTAAQELYLSVLTIGEIRYGIERLRRRDPRQAIVMAKLLKPFEASR